MKVETSPLKIQEHFIIASAFHFHQPSSSDFDVAQTFENYDLEFDFKLKQKQHGEFHIHTKIGVNNSEKPLAGYSLHLECLSIFGLNPRLELSEEDHQNYKYNSALSISINFMRAELKGITNSAPFGRYLLPSIDLKELYSEKMRQLNEQK